MAVNELCCHNEPRESRDVFWWAGPGSIEIPDAILKELSEDLKKALPSKPLRDETPRIEMPSRQSLDLPILEIW